MNRTSSGLSATLCALACTVLSACGPPLPSDADHTSPGGAVRGFTAAIDQGNGAGLTTVDWIAPSDVRAFRDLIGFSERYGLTLTLRADTVRMVATTYPTGDRAVVTFDGDVVSCTDGVLPSPDRRTVHSCASVAAKVQGHATLACVREHGRWYVSLDIGSGGALGGDTTSPPMAPAPTGPRATR